MSKSSAQTIMSVVSRLGKSVTVTDFTPSVLYALASSTQAKRRLADEYDAAQERGEVAKGSVRTDIGYCPN